MARKLRMLGWNTSQACPTSNNCPSRIPTSPTPAWPSSSRPCPTAKSSADMPTPVLDAGRSVGRCEWRGG